MNTNLGSEYIDFKGQDRMPLAYWQGFSDALGVISIRFRREGVPITKLDELRDEWHKDMQTTPHEHWMSILGPYCVACRCTMPY